MDELSAMGSIANGLLGDICTGLTQRQCLAGIQHTAVSITTAVDEVVLGLFSSSAEHGGSLEPVSNHGLRNLRTEVAQIYTKGVATSLLHISKSLLSVNLTLNDTDRTLIDAFLAKFLFILGDNGLTTVNSQ